MVDINDIKDPLDLSFNYLPLIILFAFLFLLIILLVYLSFKKRKRVLPVEINQPGVTRLSPRDNALNDLERIRKENLIELKKTDTFYNRITLILKKYLFEQYNIEVDSKTSREIIQHLKSLKLDYDFVRHFELCLKDLDFAKYSYYKTSSKDMTETLNLNYSLFTLENKINNKIDSGNLNLP